MMSSDGASLLRIRTAVGPSGQERARDLVRVVVGRRAAREEAHRPEAVGSAREGLTQVQAEAALRKLIDTTVVIPRASA